MRKVNPVLRATIGASSALTLTDIDMSKLSVALLAAIVAATQPLSAQPTAAQRDSVALERLRNDWGGLGRYRAANAALPPHAAGEKRVVFMGNSITDDWAQSFPAMFPGKPYVGRGISGQTTPQMLVRFRQDVDRAQAEGRRHPRRHERHRRQHRAVDARDDRGQPHVDDRDREGERHPRGALIGAAGVRLSVEARARARAEDRRAQRVDEALRGDARRGVPRLPHRDGR